MLYYERKELFNIDNKMHEMLQKAISEAEKNNMGVEEAIQKFTAEYNMGLLNNIPNTPEDDAYELLDKACKTSTKSKAKKYAKEALNICPDLLDAKLFLIDLEDDYLKKEKMLDEALEEEKERLTDEGLFDKDSIGLFYGIFETRPYIRGLCKKAINEADMGQMRCSIKTCVEILKLNESDNTGARYLLMCLYAYLEEEKELLKLYKKYDEEQSLSMTIPIMVYYYKQGKYDKAKKNLKMIKEINPNFIKFYTNEFKEDDKTPYGYYSHGGSSEVIMFMENYSFLMISVPTIPEFIIKNK